MARAREDITGSVPSVWMAFSVAWFQTMTALGGVAAVGGVKVTVSGELFVVLPARSAAWTISWLAPVERLTPGIWKRAGARSHAAQASSNQGEHNAWIGLADKGNVSRAGILHAEVGRARGEIKSRRRRQMRVQREGQVENAADVAGIVRGLQIDRVPPIGCAVHRQARIEAELPLGVKGHRREAAAINRGLQTEHPPGKVCDRPRDDGAVGKAIDCRTEAAEGGRLRVQGEGEIENRGRVAGLSGGDQVQNVGTIGQRAAVDLLDQRWVEGETAVGLQQAERIEKAAGGGIVEASAEARDTMDTAYRARDRGGGGDSVVVCPTAGCGVVRQSSLDRQVPGPDPAV